MPERIQLSRKKGWRMPDTTINVARPGKWGNPFRVEVFGAPLAVALYARSITGYWTPDGIPDNLIDAAYEAHMELQSRRVRYWLNPRSLRGYNLACWCGLGEPCHGDPLLKLANEA
jgi:hypothetical protein